MVTITDAFSGFSVDDVEAAREFYGTTLGLTVEDAPGAGGLTVRLPSGQGVLLYPTEAHQPARYTMLNLVVDDIDRAVDELNAAGVVTKIYSGDESYGTDERGINRGSATGMGPDIAWFRDPAGNVLSVLAE
ncbi:VOC family protein [Agromyces sp. M3QZ16-3]|uniref:VOC family protein n=1 Tax=Agromyces sp. M3QZ16-3 TaxID=3447585 RepID=UPI003F68F102